MYIHVYIHTHTHTYIYINSLHLFDYLNKIYIKTNVAIDEGNSRNERWHWTNDEIGVAVQSWLWVRVDNSVGWSVRTEFSGHGFKSDSGQLSIATSKNSSLLNSITYIYLYIYIYIYKYACIYIYVHSSVYIQIHLAH